MESMSLFTLPPPSVFARIFFNLNGLDELVRVGYNTPPRCEDRDARKFSLQLALCGLGLTGRLASYQAYGHTDAEVKPVLYLFSVNLPTISHNLNRHYFTF